MERLFKKRTISNYYIAIFLILLIAIIIFFMNMPRLMVPIGIAYVLSLILQQTIPSFTKWGMRRNLAIIIIFIGSILLVSYPLVRVVPVIKDEIVNLQQYLPEVNNFFKHFSSSVANKLQEEFGLIVDKSYFEELLSYGHENSRNVLLSIPNILASVFEWILVIPLFLFFFLRDGQLFKREFFRWVPNSLFERLYYLFYQFDKRLGDYIFAKFIEAFIIGALCLIGLLILNLRFAWLLAITAAIASIIPYVGPVIGALPAIVICLIDHGGGPMLGGVIIIYGVANVIDMGFIFPILVSKIVDLHPVVVVMSVIIGSHYMGMIGMIISIPVAAIGKLIVGEIFKELRPVFARNISDSTK